VSHTPIFRQKYDDEVKFLSDTKEAQTRKGKMRVEQKSARRPESIGWKKKGASLDRP
jgi:hypothetical protein